MSCLANSLTNIIKIIPQKHYQDYTIYQYLLMERKKIQQSSKVVGMSPDRSEVSMHSEGQPDFDHESTEKLFSFNQSFTNIEQNNKIIQEKTQNLGRIKNLQDEIRSHKTRSNLWEKTKAEIIALNKHLKLSSLSLNCSDSAIMKEFFQVVAEMLDKRQNQSVLQKSQVSQAKKKEQQLFQKLVEANKKKYEAEQKLVQYEHQIQKLSQVNDSLRQKSRAQSTMRSSKIKEFHQETILTIHQKELELGTMEQRNDELRRGIITLSQQNELLKSELGDKETQLSQKIDEHEELYLQNKALKDKLQKQLKEEGQNNTQLSQIKDYLNSIMDENIVIRQELSKRAQIINTLRAIIEEARTVNEEHISQQASINKQLQLSKSQKLQKLINDENNLKGSLKANLRFGVNQRRNSRKDIKGSLHTVRSSQSLLI